MQSAVTEPVGKARKYGVAVTGSEATLFRAVHIGTDILEYEPILEFGPDGIRVHAYPCPSERVAELGDRLATGWRPEIGTWFATMEGAYEQGMATAMGLPARFWYDVYRMPNGSIWIKRRPEGRDLSYLEHVIALQPHGEFITNEQEVERGLKGSYTQEVLAVTGSFAAAVAEAEKALRWPEASTEGAVSEYEDEPADDEEDAA